MLVVEVLKVVENLNDKRAQWLEEALKTHDYEEVAFILNGLHISPFNHNTIGHLINHMFEAYGIVFSFSATQSVWYYLNEEDLQQ